jgi:ankyrin repeat protein
MHTAISVVVKHQIYNKSIEILKVLINKGANPNATNALGQTAIFYAATQSKVH